MGGGKARVALGSGAPRIGAGSLLKLSPMGKQPLPKAGVEVRAGPQPVPGVQPQWDVPTDSRGRVGDSAFRGDGDCHRVI